MTLPDLEAAAFWDRGVCLHCSAVQDEDAAADDHHPVCEECGNDAVYSAAFLLRVYGWVEGEEA